MNTLPNSVALAIRFQRRRDKAWGNYRKHRTRRSLKSAMNAMRGSLKYRQWQSARSRRWPESLTKEQAQFVRWLRVEKMGGSGMTWRSVAREASMDARFPFVCIGHQIDGMELCNMAMTVLGETVDGGGWN